MGRARLTVCRALLITPARPCALAVVRSGNDLAVESGTEPARQRPLRNENAALDPINGFVRSRWRLRIMSRSIFRTLGLAAALVAVSAAANITIAAQTPAPTPAQKSADDTL